VLARPHGRPFDVVAPRSTVAIDGATRAALPLEERPASEITEGYGRRTAPEGVKVFAPAFDVTPAELVTAIVTEAGIVHAPDETGMLAIMAKPGLEVPAPGG
jgi:methylthioribose-1-phosphate isomerase